MEKRKWGGGSNQYKLRQGTNTPRQTAATEFPANLPTGSTGRVTWDRSRIDLTLIPESPLARSLFRFKKTLPEFIWNTAALEGNTFTLPEVRTLLDGVTVGGKRLEEAQQIIALSEALNAMAGMVEQGTFNLSESTSKKINALVTQHEIIDPGLFRGQGVIAGGGGTVRLADGYEIDGDHTGHEGAQLAQDYENLLASIGELTDGRERALAYFASATRSQFYYDGNKRTARIMMAGELMTSGYEPVSVPYSRVLEFNESLATLFRRDEATGVMAFLTTCTPPELGD